MRRPDRRRAGFSLIEALVAMAIASIGLVAIFELQHQLTGGQRRYERAMVRADMRRNMLSILRGLNPLAQPTGHVDLPPNQQLRWVSRPISGLRQTTGFPTGDGPFLVQLYTVTAQIQDPSGRSLEQMSFDRVGWRKITPAAGAPAPAAGAAGPATPGQPTTGSAPF